MKTIALALLLAGGLWWLTTFFTATPLGQATVDPANNILTLPTGAGSIRDELVLDLTVDDASRGEVRGTLVWNAAGRLSRFPLVVRGDGVAHRYRLPLGTQPGWPPSQPQLRLQLEGAPGTVHAATLARRGWGAVDALSMALLTRLLPEPLPWRGVVLLCALLGVLGVAALWPWGSLHARIIGGCCIVACGFGLVTARDQWAVTSERWPLAQLPEVEAQAHVTHYEASASINALLVQAQRLPPGARVLVVDGPAGYLLYRAQYLLYPRSVVPINGDDPASLRAVLGDYDALLVARPLAGVLLPGWNLASASEGAQLWRRGTSGLGNLSEPGGSMLELILGVLVVLLAGLGLHALLAPAATSWELRLSMALPLGMLVLAVWMSLLAAFGIAWSGPLVAGPLVLGGGIGLWRGHAPRPRLYLPRIDMLSIGLLAIIVAEVGWTVAVTHTLPFGDQDTWTTWGFKARGWALDRGMLPLLLRARGDSLHHLSYPPGWSLFLAWGGLAQGGISERNVKLSIPLVFCALLLVTFHACRRWTSCRIALLWTAWLASTPLLLDQATLGDADLALTLCLVAMMIPLLDWLMTGRRRDLLLAATLGGAAAWIKLDGLGLALLLLGAAVLVRTHHHGARTLVAGGAAAILICAIIAPWLVAVRLLHLGGEAVTPSMRYLGRGIGVVVEELLVSHTNSSWGPLGGSFGLLWLTIIAGMIIGFGRIRRSPPLLALALMVGGTIAVYIVLYGVRPYFSVERYLMHAAPLGVVLLAGIAVSAKEVQLSTLRVES